MSNKERQVSETTGASSKISIKAAIRGLFYIGAYGQWFITAMFAILMIMDGLGRGGPLDIGHDVTLTAFRVNVLVQPLLILAWLFLCWHYNRIGVFSPERFFSANKWLSRVTKLALTLSACWWLLFAVFG